MLVFCNPTGLDGAGELINSVIDMVVDDACLESASNFLDERSSMIQFAKRIWAAALCLGVVSGLGASASAAFIPVFGTGTTSTGALAAPGSVDSNYTLVSNAAGTGSSAFVGTNRPGTWVGNTATSQWISPTANSGALLVGGVYDYRTTFSLAGLDAATASITGQVASDDSVVILLNGTAVGSFSGFTSLAAFTINSGFVAGLNTLDFVVTNTLALPTSPTGLQVNITSATANAVVPEPASIVLVSLGGIALAGFGLRRRVTA